ncbi:putative fibrinogen C domain-containing protein 1 [Apostichopus japonicus]|uniref:Putative fibrinogen C domain-containing protein 1 n=1 Tax=Stichopus japonicus TaxID=307972 RepID=A0A2G8JYJ1_STIJA|nr:putative fibrinogen C domain-containing protein 1 [Apostichopus japonicus]
MGLDCLHESFDLTWIRLITTEEGDFYVNSRCSRKSTCRNNQIIQASYQCSDHATCAERNGVRKCYCNPNYQGDGETCTHNCFVADIGSVLGERFFYFNSRCTQKSICRNNRLVIENYQCNSQATCAERNGVRKCYCNPTYKGDGETCIRGIAKDCYELYVSGIRCDGVYTIYPDGLPSGIQVYCEMESNGGGWTVSFTNNLGFKLLTSSPYTLHPQTDALQISLK